MPGKVFINYRRGDDAGFTQALYQRLEDEFTADDLFMDVEGHIQPGDDFVEVLNTQVAASDVLLVVIGPRWVELLAARQGDPDDFVAIEIKAGFDQDKRIIPVLVGGADMPRADSLPEAIKLLARRNAVGLRPERFRADCQGLITALKEQLAAAEQEHVERSEAERAAAEEARRQREAEEAARIAAAEERARAQAVAGLSPEEIRKAEELANWDFIKERDNLQGLRDHLARFPGGVTTLYAQTRLEELVWAGLGASADTAALEDFLEEFPKGVNSEAARTRLANLQERATQALKAEQRRSQETEDWGTAAGSSEPGPINDFLSKWPDGQHAAAAKARLRELTQGPGAQRRGILIGAGATACLVAVIAGGWWTYEHQQWIASLEDTSLKVIDFGEQRAKAGQPFKECDSCPEMVVIPAGNFSMGSPASEPERDNDESQVKVTVAKPFAVSKHEVTFVEWDACVEAGACNGYKPTDAGWGRGKRPAIFVSWNDAKAYVTWVAAKTGKPYRLLSEAEWEYAARAGTTTPFWWGSSITPRQANYDGSADPYKGGGSKGKYRSKTVPVDSFKPNPWGLYNVHGNVWEWTEDCWNGSNTDNPGDGSARTVGDCGRRVVRGGSWDSGPRGLRSAFRLGGTADDRFDLLGFRVARTLNP